MQFIVPTMAIVSFEVHRSSRRAKIELRPSGLLAVILSWFGLSSAQTYAVDVEGYHVATNNRATHTKTYIPWPHAAGCYLKISKPLETLFTGFGLISGSSTFLLQKMWLQGGGMLLIGVLFVIAFLMSRKRTSVAILADNGATETFKVIADPDQMERLKEYFELLKDSIARAEGVVGSDWRSSGETTQDKRRTVLGSEGEKEVESDPLLTSCPHCKAQMKIKPSFLGRWANCPGCKNSFLVS